MRTVCLLAVVATLALPMTAARAAEGTPASPACCRGGHGGSHGGGSRPRSYGSPRSYGAPRSHGGAPRAYRAPKAYRAPGTFHAPRVPRAPRAYHAPREHRERAPRAPRVHHTPPAPRHATPHAPGARDRHGRLKRSEEAKREFMRRTGHPHGWPGHVIDHITPLACGGSDSPGNMQWQTIEEAKAKDGVERRGCRR